MPVGDVHYQGRTLHFSREYLGGLARAFNAKAYDQVPFQLAGPDNRHTNDPERYAGEIVGLDLAEDGLYATAMLTERGSKLLAENPQLGVSARIVEGYERSDGQYFDAAIQHVLATLDPKIPGLGGWQAVEASNDVQITIDLSSTHFEGDPEPVPATFTGQPPPWADLIPADATSGEIDALLDALEEVAAEDALLELWAQGVDLPPPQPRYSPPGEADLAQLARIQETLDMSSALDELRTIEDAEPLPRRSEDRLSHLLGRVGRGSYTTAASSKSAATSHPPNSRPPTTVRTPASPRPASQHLESPDSPGRFT